jgi:mycothione reductase
VEIASGNDEGAKIRANTVLIAAGTRPAIPDIDGIEGVDYLTSTEALQLETPPEELVIVGGGYIAAELGHFFGTFGSEVTIIGRRPELLPATDPEIAAAFTDQYRERFTVHTGHEATRVSERNGKMSVDARPYEYGTDRGGVGGEAITATGDQLLIAAGRKPNSDLLDLETTGVETDENGYIETDEFLRTTADGIWALGDIVGEYLLKHTANHEARAVTRNLFGEGLQPVDYTAMPYAVFASPEVAGVGATEADVREANREYATRTYQYDETARGSAMKSDGFLKVIIDYDGQILGCHIMGPEASTLIQEVVLAMKAGSGNVRDIRNSVHIHPALSEVVQRGFSGQFTTGDISHDH